MTARHDRSGDQARLGRRGRRQLRRGPLRGLRPGRRRGDRRGADRQPQPHRRRGALELQPSTAAISARPTASASCSTAWASSAIRSTAGTADEVLEEAIEAGADDVVSGDGEDGARDLLRPGRSSTPVREALEKSLGQPVVGQADLAAAGRPTPVEGEAAADPVRADRGARRQRRRAERLRQFRGVGRRSGEVRGLTGDALIGLDPGLRLTGWGVIDVEGNRLRHVAHGVVTDAGRAIAGRAAWASCIDGDRRGDRRAAAGRGRGRGDLRQRQPGSTLKLGHARGVVMLAPARAGLPVFEYAANLVKKSVTGTGHADKAQVAMMVGRLLPGVARSTADAADALAVAICHAHPSRATGPARVEAALVIAQLQGHLVDIGRRRQRRRSTSTASAIWCRPRPRTLARPAAVGEPVDAAGRDHRARGRDRALRLPRDRRARLVPPPARPCRASAPGWRCRSCSTLRPTRSPARSPPATRRASAGRRASGPSSPRGSRPS